MSKISYVRGVWYIANGPFLVHKILLKYNKNTSFLIPNFAISISVYTNNKILIIRFII